MAQERGKYFALSRAIEEQQQGRPIRICLVEEEEIPPIEEVLDLNNGDFIEVLAEDLNSEEVWKHISLVSFYEEDPENSDACERLGFIPYKLYRIYRDIKEKNPDLVCINEEGILISEPWLVLPSHLYRYHYDRARHRRFNWIAPNEG
jgi:hypothetical protein